MPARKELAVEEQQVVELEVPLQPQQRAPLEPLQGGQLRFRREQRGEGCEVQRHVLQTVLACPRNGRADEPLVETVRRRAESRHRRERKRRAAAADGEVEKTGGQAVRPESDHEQRVLVVQAEERVERHHEAALRLRAAPDCAHLVAQVGARVGGREDPHLVAALLEARHRLPDLADRPAVERERRGLDHCLVAVVERVQAVPRVQAERILRRAEHGDAPAARVRELEEPADELGEPIRRTDRIAGDNRDPADDLVREEPRLVRVEEVRLVTSEDERRERVDPPRGDEIACELALARFLLDAVTPGSDPLEHEQRDGGDREHQHGDGKPVAERQRDDWPQRRRPLGQVVGRVGRGLRERREGQGQHSRPPHPGPRG